MTAPVPERFMMLALAQFDGEWAGLDVQVQTILAPVLADLRAQVQALDRPLTHWSEALVRLRDVLALLGGGGSLTAPVHKFRCLIGDGTWVDVVAVADLREQVLALKDRGDTRNDPAYQMVYRRDVLALLGGGDT